ncbi:Hypothetical protein A7982_02631 [Minicystis rosea]|nr:Hypothetical protein A7982_02631 [Minicystis rosea]
MSRHPLSLLLLVLSLGCDPAPPVSSPVSASAGVRAAVTAPPPAPASASPTPVPRTAKTPLFVTYAGPARFKEGSNPTLTVTIRNDGSAPETLNLFVLSIPQLSLDVSDASGQVLSPMPPPIPPDHMDTAVLAPGATRSFSLPLDAHSPPLPKGRYTVWLRDGRAYGTPFPFAVE